MSQFLIILPCQIWCCPTSWQSLLVSQLQKLIRILRGQFLYVPCWLDQAGVEEWNGLNLLSVAGGDMVLEVHGDSCPTPCILNSVALFLVNAYSEMSDSFNLFIYIYTCGYLCSGRIHGTILHRTHMLLPYHFSQQICHRHLTRPENPWHQ